MRRAAALSARALGRSSSPALAFGAWAARLSGFALFLLSLALLVPWVTITVPGLSTVGSTISYWPAGVATQGPFVGYYGILNSPLLGGVDGAFKRGLAAGFALNIIGWVLAILSTVFSSRAVRLMSGGRAACCSACACVGCGCCCSSKCCGPPPVDAASRTVRARCSATTSAVLNALVAVAAAAAAAAVGVGSTSFIATFGVGVALGLITTSAPGVGIASFAVVVAVAAAGFGVANLYNMAESDFKADSGSNAAPTTVIARVVSARL
jgi:hypothetical protein